MRRIPSGMLFAIIIAGASLAILAVVLNLTSPPSPELLPRARLIQLAPVIVHFAAGMSLGWSVLAAIIARFGTHDRTASSRPDLLAVLDIAVMACALIAAVVMVYVASMEVLFRTLLYRFESTRHVIASGRYGTLQWGYGLLDLAAIAAALAISWIRHRSDALITVLFWTLILAALWASYLIPSGGNNDIAWVICFLIANSLILGLFTLTAGWAEHRRRRHAWPDRLDDLLEPRPPWPGFHQSAGIVAATHLVVSCILIHNPAIFLVALVDGICMLILASRRWEENLADSGLALLTLAMVSLCMLFMPAAAYTSPNARFAEIFNRALIGLSIMTWLWYWLASVWKQQLDQDGQPWTTAGRMIRINERVGYLVAATAVLLAFHLAVWPKFEFVYITDMERYRWIEGLIGYGLLAGALLIWAKKARKTTLAWLAFLTIASAIAFVLIRGPHFAITRWWVLTWPLMLAGCAMICVVLAPLAQRSRTRQIFVEPLLVSGTCFLPILAVFGTEMLRTTPENMPPWLPVATMCVMTTLYLVAAFLIGPRKLLLVAALCAGLALWYGLG